MTVVNYRFKAFLQKRALHLVLILASGMIAYGNSLHVPFQWDENFYLRNNPLVAGAAAPEATEPPEGRPIVGKREILTGQELSKTVRARYVGYLTFAWNYRLHGFSVKGYHLVNIAIHLLNALLVFALVGTLFTVPLLAGSAVRGWSGFIALFSALLFVSHPIQTEAVTYIMQRLASLTALFCLCAAVSYLRYRTNANHAKRVLWYLGALAATALAMKTKENAFVLPLMLAVLELLFFPRTGRRRWLLLVPFLATMLIIPYGILVHAKTAAGLPGPPQQGFSLQYAITQIRVVAAYIGLLLVPVHQTVYHGYRLASTFFQPALMLSALFLAFLAGAGGYLYRRASAFDPGMRLVPFGIAWFFLFLVVESSVYSLPFVMCEYRVYLPSVGLFAGVVAGLFLLFTRFRNGAWMTLLAGALVLTVAAYVLATRARNAVWESPVKLWEEAAAEAPSSSAVRTRLAQSYLQVGRYEEALEQYQASLDGGFDHPQVRLDMGNALVRLGRSSEAIDQYHAALRFYPEFVEAYGALADVYMRTGNYREAADAYAAALRYAPDLIDARINLAGCNVQLGRFRDALRELQQVLIRQPDNEDARYNLHVVQELLEKNVSRY